MFYHKEINIIFMFVRGKLSTTSIFIPEATRLKYSLQLNFVETKIRI